MLTLPVLDMADFLADPSTDGGRRFVDELLAAAHGPGFVYLTGHGVDPALDVGIFDQARAFFALPADEREALAIEHSAAFRGYTVLGDERTNGESDWRHQLDLGPEQDAPDPGAGGPAWLRLRGPNQWPPSLPSMPGAVLGWMAAMDAVGLGALRALALGMGQPIDRWDGGFVPESDVHLKIIHYPPRRETAADQGVGLHRDTGLLTFIAQDDTGGLQVQLGDELIDAPAVDGAYLMNLGEMLETATDGYLRATPHRVVSPVDGPGRISVAYFFNPRFESPFLPIELPPELAVDAPGARREVDGPIFEVFGENNLKTRLRSHPDVARRHYADVI
ncbi:MAG: 2-oxoglutarate and iron-dependent oxygenase domain-containing protein [Actinomycetota bacterium]